MSIWLDVNYGVSCVKDTTLGDFVKSPVSMWDNHHKPTLSSMVFGKSSTVTPQLTYHRRDFRVYLDNTARTLVIRQRQLERRMKINLVDLDKAIQKCADGYIPVFAGQEMRPEGSLPEASLENLRQLLAAGLEVKWFRVGPDRSVLVEFETGENYLATGFSFGEPGDLTWAFAQFAEEAGEGVAKINFNFLAAMPQDLQGPIPIPPRPRNPLDAE